MLFGRHVGKTFNHMYQEETHYCQWGVMTAESGEPCSTGLIRLAQFCVDRECGEASDSIPQRMVIDEMDEEEELEEEFVEVGQQDGDL